MSKEDPTPAEREKILQAAFPNIEARLSRPGDPELSSVAISFYPKSGQSTPQKPSERLKDGVFMMRAEGQSWEEFKKACIKSFKDNELIKE